MRSSNNRFLILLGIFFILSTFIFLVRTLESKTATYVDAKMYYTITRSVVKDSDLNFVNEFKKFSIKTDTGKNGLPINIQPPGTSIVWIYPFLETDYLVTGLKTLGFNFENSGYELTYQIGLGIFNIYLSLAGFLFLYLFLRSFFSKKISLTTIIFLFGATNLLYYISFEPLNSHIPSFFLSALLFYYLEKQKKFSIKDAFFAGLITGFAALVRTQDFLLFLIPAGYIYIHFSKKPDSLITLYPIFLSGIFIGFIPQIYYWKVVFDTFWKSPYINYGFSLLKPKPYYVLFNLHNGLFSTTPILLFSFVFLILYLKKNKLISGISLIYFLIQLVVVSSYSMYYQFDSYAIRMLITTYPLLSLGLSNLIDSLSRKIGYQKLVLIGLLFILMNIYLIFNFLNNFRFI